MYTNGRVAARHLVLLCTISLLTLGLSHAQSIFTNPIMGTLWVLILDKQVPTQQDKP